MSLLKQYGPERRLLHKDDDPGSILKTHYSFVRQSDGSTVFTRENVPQTEGLVGLTATISPDRKTVTDCVVQYLELHRYFEKQVLAECGPVPLKDDGTPIGGGYRMLPLVLSRICGVCPPPYSICGAMAIENALNISISHQAYLLRKILLAANWWESHAVHVAGLVMPRMLGITDILQLKKVNPELLAKIKTVYKLGSDIVAAIGGGQSVHPLSVVVGGFQVTDPDGVADKITELLALLKSDAVTELYDLVVDLYASTARAFQEQYPLLVDAPEHEFVSLRKPGEYAILDGNIFSSVTGYMTPKEYCTYIYEQVSDRSTAKLVYTNNDGNGVHSGGALARLQNQEDVLQPKTREVLERLGLRFPQYGWWYNTAAQIAEMHEARHMMIQAMEELLQTGIKYEFINRLSVFRGIELLSKEELLELAKTLYEGIGVIEAPRGTMNQGFTVNGVGDIVKADVVIPTGKNQVSISVYLKLMIQRCLDEGWDEEKIRFYIDVIMSHPDFCISCATHMFFVVFDHIYDTVVKRAKSVVNKLAPARPQNVAIVAFGNTSVVPDNMAQVVREILEKMFAGSTLHFIDGGVSAMNTFFDCERKGFDKIICLDAAHGLGSLGEVLKLNESELLALASNAQQTSAHDATFVQALRLMRYTQSKIPQNITSYMIEVEGLENPALVGPLATKAAGHIAHELEHVLGLEHGHEEYSNVLSVVQ